MIGPLSAIADLCKQLEVDLHVDAAWVRCSTESTRQTQSRSMLTNGCRCRWVRDVSHMSLGRSQPGVPDDGKLHANCGGLRPVSEQRAMVASFHTDRSRSGAPQPRPHSAATARTSGSSSGRSEAPLKVSWPGGRSVSIPNPGSARQSQQRVLDRRVKSVAGFRDNPGGGLPSQKSGSAPCVWPLDNRRHRGCLKGRCRASLDQPERAGPVDCIGAVVHPELLVGAVGSFLCR